MNKSRIAVIGGICLFIAALLYGLQPWNYYFEFRNAAAVDPEIHSVSELQSGHGTAPPSAIEFTGDQKFPLKIFINTESMNIEADIFPVGQDSRGHMDVTNEPFGIAWYEPGPAPGWQGNAILAGHNVYDGVPGSFEHLYTLVSGDEVAIEYVGGSKGRFLVQSNDTYPVDSAPDSVMDVRGETRVTLIACAGENIPALGGFSHRVIVILYPVEYRET